MTYIYMNMLNIMVTTCIFIISLVSTHNRDFDALTFCCNGLLCYWLASLRLAKLARCHVDFSEVAALKYVCTACQYELRFRCCDENSFPALIRSYKHILVKKVGCPGASEPKKLLLRLFTL